jgi:hypothetical protein
LLGGKIEMAAGGVGPGLAEGDADGLDAGAGCDAEGDATGLADPPGDVAGVADAPGCVPGLAGAGFAACGGGVAIGPAGAGFFCANSATVISMAWLIGIRAVPLFLSTQL